MNLQAQEITLSAEHEGRKVMLVEEMALHVK